MKSRQNLRKSGKIKKEMRNWQGKSEQKASYTNAKWHWRCHSTGFATKSIRYHQLSVAVELMHATRIGQERATLVGFGAHGAEQKDGEQQTHYLNACHDQNDDFDDS